MADSIVLGAGIVGVATALALQARGRDVVLIDRGKPGRETSFGNAGIIQAEAAEPYAMPRGISDFFSIALRRSNDVNWHINAIPGYAKPLLQYFLNSAPARHRAISRVYSGLIGRSTRDHAPLIEAAGVEALMRHDGFRQAFRSKADLEEAVLNAERFKRDYDVASIPLDSSALSAAEPNLLQPMAGAIHWTGSWTCSDPGELVAAYANLFRSRGGMVVIGDALTLARKGAAWTVQGQGDTSLFKAGEVIIALGPWSVKLCRRFGLQIPMLRKRGYHCHYKSDAGPDLPLMDSANGAVIAPMKAGVRITTGAELSLQNAAPTPIQLNRALKTARELFALNEPVESKPWMGDRPCMPDMLPVVGAVPGQSGLWAHFGHGYQGFTLGPTTAALLVDQMIDAAAPVEVLSPNRRFRVL